MGISAIVAARNAAKFMRIALLSLQKQLHKDFEVIVVVDPSEDQTAQIAAEFVSNDRRFSLIENKTRQGLSMSRYIGLARANKEHVLFVDADDHLDLNAFSEMESQIGEADVLVYGHYKYRGGRSLPSKNPLAGELDGISATRKLLADYEMRPVLWNKLFKRSLFEGDILVLPPGRFPPSGENLLFLLAPMLRAKKVLCVTDHYYHHRHNHDGLSKAPGLTDRAEGRLLCYEYIGAYLQKKEPSVYQYLMDTIERYKLTLYHDVQRDRLAGLRTYKSYRRRLKKELAACEEKGPFSEGGLYEGKDLKDVLLTFPPR